jgi:uncharacterized membrane protein YciS (DUF1049 family)
MNTIIILSIKIIVGFIGAWIVIGLIFWFGLQVIMHKTGKSKEEDDWGV